MDVLHEPINRPNVIAKTTGGGGAGSPLARMARFAIAFVLLASALAAFTPTGADAAGGFDVRTNVVLCPDGFNGVTASASDLFQYCTTPVGSATIAVVIGEAAPSGQTDLDGNYELTDLPTGYATIYGFMPDQSWLSRGFCVTYPIGSSSTAYGEVSAGQNGASFTMGADQTLDCRYFAYTTTTSEPVSVNVRLHSCPEGFDGINSNIYDFAQYCHTPIGGSVIAVVFGEAGPSGQTDLDGNWSLDDIPAGTVTVHQFPVEQGLAIRAFCKQADGLTGEGRYYEAPVGQGSASWNLRSGQFLDCDWYNFPFVDQTTATVAIRLHKCPNGYHGSSASIYDLAADCQGTPEDVNFTITPLFSPAQTTPTDSIGWVTWEGIPSGKMTIQQQVPSGVTYQRVFCNQRKITGESTGRVEVAEAPDGTLTDFLLSGYDSYDCDWYNISDFSAADGTPTSDDEDADVELDDAAGTPVVDEETDEETGNGGTGGTGGTGDSGNDGNGGNGTVNEPDDDLDDESTDGNDQETAPDTDGDAGGATSLTITLFTCPAGYDLFAEGASPADDCQQVEQDVEFTSLGDRSGITASKFTDEDGQAIYPRLGSGHHLITAHLPYSVDYAFILGCSSNVSSYASPLYPVAFAGPNGEISIDVQKGEQLSCSWYNVPD
ncbi:MAG: hypothetical protein IT336_11680 [Thermomicrobiales bacterium]|nr:hypothetical protein [Thermomicrobiales bacterium]